MKIWLNHTLACPDDASYPFSLLIFHWESSEDQFKNLLGAYQASTLYNFRNKESPLEIQTIESGKDNDTINKNLQQLQSETGIIHLVKSKDAVLLHDANVIDVLPLHGYLRHYLDILEEFAWVYDHSKFKPANEAFHVVTHTIQSKILSLMPKSTKIQNDIKHVEEFLIPILQDLLFLNIFLTYLEIEEGLLVCKQCKRWFPIIKTIPRLYPKTMKREEMDLEFKGKWSKLFPDDVVMD